MKRKLSLKIFAIPSFVILFFHIVGLIGISMFINGTNMDASGKTALYVLAFVGFFFNLIPLVFNILGSLLQIKRMYTIGTGINYIVGVFVIFYLFFIIFLPLSENTPTNQELSYVVSAIFIVCLVFLLICMALNAITSFISGKKNRSYMFMRISAILAIVFFIGFLIGGVGWIAVHDANTNAGLILCIIFLGLAYLVLLGSSIIYSCFDVVTNKEEQPSLINETKVLSTKNTNKDDVLYCPNCGAKLPKDAKFCHKCGYDISNISN